MGTLLTIYIKSLRELLIRCTIYLYVIKMIRSAKLDESADIIAKTERDTAWREMAKQVAHEIKNPLTPMKLSIQHLQRMAQSDLPDMGDRIERISKTLLEQFNNLNNIANSFSNFATMPQASNEKLILNEVVESVHDLFRKREDINITLSEPINDLFVHADRNHIVRVLNNIIYYRIYRYIIKSNRWKCRN